MWDRWFAGGRLAVVERLAVVGVMTIPTLRPTLVHHLLLPTDGAHLEGLGASLHTYFDVIWSSLNTCFDVIWKSLNNTSKSVFWRP